MKAILCEKLVRIQRYFTKGCTTPFTEQSKLALARVESEVGGLVQKDLKHQSLQFEKQMPHQYSDSGFIK